MSNSKKIYIETYGCQMNVADSELVVSILEKEGYTLTQEMKEADVIFVNTCSIRDNAEVRIYGRLSEFKQVKKQRSGVLIGVLGCMAERLKEKLIEQEKMVDILAGPDSYRSLPKLIETAENGQKAINVLLSREETYADISPVRYDSNGISAFVSIMRGCDNMCSYCVVPFTRGRERSRKPETILSEIKELIDNNYKEVTLLGQNVDKYKYQNPESNEITNFAQLLKLVAEYAPMLRIRFATSYPQDMTDEVLSAMATYPNVCKYIHLPVQSGSTTTLTNMKRGYTRDYYMQRIEAIRRIVPDCGISSDFIAGFCGETEEDHQQTLSLMREVGFEFSYMFKYSERPNTYAARKMVDDVPEEVKTRRLTEIIELQNQLSLESNQRDIGKVFEVLVEGVSKKSENNFFGRNSQNKVVVFPRENYQVGDLVKVRIEECSSATLKGKSCL